MKTRRLSRIGILLLVALVLLGLSGVAGLSAEEIERINIAQGKTAYASSNQRGQDPHLGKRESRFLTDGNDTSFMVLHEDDEDQWFSVDLGEPIAIDTVRLIWGANDQYPDAYATAYTIEVGETEDETGWQTVASVTDGAMGEQTLSFASVTARFVRIKVLEKADKWASLREIKIYQTPSEPPKDDTMKVLFIGNSHTYTNDVPAIVKDMLEASDRHIEYKAITAGGQSLEYHASQSGTIREIQQGDYDFVIFQEKASGFDPEVFARGYEKLYAAVQETDAQPVLYMIWSNESLPYVQKTITEAYVSAAEKTGAKLAAAGVAWDIIRHQHTDLKLYSDGNHATPLGSYLAAASIGYALTGAEEAFAVPEGDALAARLKLSEANCRLMQETAFSVAKSGYDVTDLVWNGDIESEDGNLARGRDAYASSNQRGSDPHIGKRQVRYLTDGAEDNFIVLHEADEDPWFMVDFGRKTSVAEVRLVWGADSPYQNAYAVRYELQVSTTGETSDWQTVATIENGALETRTISFQQTETRFLRIKVLEKGGQYASLRELYAYAKATEETKPGTTEITLSPTENASATISETTSTPTMKTTAPSDVHDTETEPVVTRQTSSSATDDEAAKSTTDDMKETSFPSEERTGTEAAPVATGETLRLLPWLAGALLAAAAIVFFAPRRRLRFN